MLFHLSMLCDEPTATATDTATVTNNFKPSVNFFGFRTVAYLLVGALWMIYTAFVLVLIVSIAPISYDNETKYKYYSNLGFVFLMILLQTWIFPYLTYTMVFWLIPTNTIGHAVLLVSSHVPFMVYSYHL